MTRLSALAVVLAVLVVVSGRAEAKGKHSEITVSKKVDKASPSLMPAKKNGTGSTKGIKINRQRLDPYKSYKFR
jgi:type VI protein secretion system component Hcp